MMTMMRWMRWNEEYGLSDGRFVGSEPSFVDELVVKTRKVKDARARERRG